MRRIGSFSLGILLITGLWAAGAPSQGLRPALARSAAITHAAPRQLVVFKRFGAALRVTPSSSASIRHTLPCGSMMQVVGVQGGWFHVIANGSRVHGWIGGARVADAANPPAFDCTDSYTFQVGDHAYTYVKTGCLSLRVSPSRIAVYHSCVRNFHDYTVTNGPIAVAGEDWFGVTSTSTGGGWALAQYLLPYHMNG
ncbi:MAG TPA: SH3 domain-containing protein [Chloroflexota bacterium]|nr:SH3 domain-containing protein [Chloroflexota bacterium]